MSAVTTIHDANALLVFSVGPVLCCAPTLTVEAVIMPPHIHKTPGSDRNHPGVFRHSSGMVSVVDLRQRFGVEEAAWVAPGRMIVTEIAGGHAGFLVDNIIDVMLWPEEGWGATPPLVPREIFKRTLMLNNQIHLYADFEKLFHFRESGYLREHIAMLIERQKVKTDTVQPVDPAKASTPVHIETVIAPLQKAVEIQPVPSVEHPAQGDNGYGQQKPLARKPLQARKESRQPANVQASKKTVLVDQKKRVTPEIVETASLSLIPAHQNIQQLEPITESSGKVYIFGIIILLLVAGIILSLSFNKSDTARDYPDSEKIVDPDVSPDVAVEPVVQDNYRANISEDEEGIVITIDEDETEVLSQHELPVHQPDALPVKPEVMETSADTTLTLPVSTVQNKVIIHVIKKGDTLWDIANYYVRDPWRYPELAELSKIKNPHLIYPGNKVKIIIRSVKKPANK